MAAFFCPFVVVSLPSNSSEAKIVKCFFNSAAFMYFEYFKAFSWFVFKRYVFGFRTWQEAKEKKK